MQNRELQKIYNNDIDKNLLEEAIKVAIDSIESQLYDEDLKDTIKHLENGSGRTETRRIMLKV